MRMVSLRNNPMVEGVNTEAGNTNINYSNLRTCGPRVEKKCSSVAVMSISTVEFDLTQLHRMLDVMINKYQDSWKGSMGSIVSVNEERGMA